MKASQRPKAKDVIVVSITRQRALTNPSAVTDSTASAWLVDKGWVRDANGQERFICLRLTTPSDLTKECQAKEIK